MLTVNARIDFVHLEMDGVNRAEKRFPSSRVNIIPADIRSVFR